MPTETDLLLLLVSNCPAMPGDIYAALCVSPNGFRIAAEDIKAFKADCDNWDGWALNAGAQFSAAMSEDRWDYWKARAAGVAKHS